MTRAKKGQQGDEVEVREGGVRIVLPRAGLGGPRGPAGKGPVFMNPAMALCRDVTVALYRALPERKRRQALDGLAGTGVRGLRLALEDAGLYKEITMNDVMPAAHRAIERNIDINGPEGVRATRRPFNSLVHDETFTYIDIDPYGSPVPFVDAAVQAAGRGALGVTATDTAALCGSSPKACLRRYGARACRSHFMHEAGLRILIGYIVRVAARYDKAATPVLSHATDHYMRTYISLEKGARKAEGALDLMGHTVLHGDGRVETVASEVDAGRGDAVWGPLWMGPLHDKATLDAMEVPAKAAEARAFGRNLSLWKGEVDMGPMFYDVDELSRGHRKGPPKMDALLKAIEAEGFRAVRTQFSPKGFKTDMGHGDVVALMERL